MSVLRKRVAVLGATGHVGKCVTAALLGHGGQDVTAVVRDTAALGRFLETVPGGADARACSFDEFRGRDFDVIVNCVGVGSPDSIRSLGEDIFDLTERFDRLVLEYVDRRPETLCIAFSSGAVYGSDFSTPGTGSAPRHADRESLARRDYYGQAKLASEARHRSASERFIVDLRLFGLFSKYADVQARSLMGDVYRAVSLREMLTVSAEDVVRDYVDPYDLFGLLQCVMLATPRNDAFDVYSAAPIGKFALLEAFAERYDLRFTVGASLCMPDATGSKPMYFSTDRRAASIGYQPEWTSLEALFRATDALMSDAR